MRQAGSTILSCNRLLCAVALSAGEFLCACGGKSLEAGASAGTGGATAAGGATATGGAAGNANTIALTRGGWDVTASVTPIPMPMTMAGPPQSESFAFTLDVLDDGGALSGVLGQGGNAAAFSLQRTSSTDAHLQTELEQFVSPGDLSSIDGAYALSYSALQLTASDSDHDGVADQLFGTGTGSALINCGDCMYSIPVQIQLLGVPDRTAPRVTIPSDGIDPLVAWTIDASEPLASASLSLTGDSVVALPSTRDDTVLVTFGTPQILPFSGKWQVTGSGRDFVNNPLDLSRAQVTTMTDPGIFTQDGFESALHAALSSESGVMVVDSTSGLPIPDGTHALLLKPDAAATFHLTRKPGQSQLSFTAVDLSGDNGGDGAYGRFEAGVIGGTQRVPVDWARTTTSVATTNADWPLAGVPVTASAILKETGPDVVLVLSAVQNCTGLCAPQGGLLIDDLKLE